MPSYHDLHVEQNDNVGLIYLCQNLMYLSELNNCLLHQVYLSNHPKMYQKHKKHTHKKPITQKLPLFDHENNHTKGLPAASQDPTKFKTCTVHLN